MWNLEPENKPAYGSREQNPAATQGVAGALEVPNGKKPRGYPMIWGSTLEKLHTVRGKIVIPLILLCAAALGVWFYAYGQADTVQLTLEEQNWLGNRQGVINLGVRFNFPPYEIYNLDEQYKGITAEYIRLMEQRLGLRFQLVRLNNHLDMVEKLQNGVVDAVSVIEPVEDHGFIYTSPYISVPASIITRKDLKHDLNLEMMKGMKVGLSISSAFEKYLHKKFGKPLFILLRPVGGYVGGLRSLSVGDFDALICDAAVASHYIAMAGIGNLRIAGDTDFNVTHSMAVRKDSDVLAGILEKGISSLSALEKTSIKEKWQSLQYIPLWEKPSFWLWVLLPALGTGALIFLILLWNRSLRTQVARRTKALQFINSIFLQSIACRTEIDVITLCLREGMLLAESEEALYVRVQGIDIIPEHKSGEALCPQGAQLEATHLKELHAGKPVTWTLSSLHVALFPLEHKQENYYSILFIRREKAFTSEEISLLQEAIFAFQEALNRKKAEQKLLEKEMQVQQAQRLESIGALAGGIAHDFNNMISSVINNGELVLIFHEVEEEVNELISATLEAAYRGRDMIKQLLAFSRREDARREWLPLNPLVEETLSLLHASIPSHVQVSTELAENEPKIYANATQMYQIILNLCTNALYAMQDDMRGPAKLHIRISTTSTPPRQMSNILDQQGLFVCVSVQDTGCGMPAELSEKIFSPYFTTKPAHKGTGLGLAMVKSITESHGGFIDVKSEPDQGTEMRVYFPAEKKERVPQATPEAGRVKKDIPHILFIDDEKNMAMSLKKLMELNGYKVTVSFDGYDGLNVFSTAPEVFDLVVTDHNMPKLMGNILVQRIHEIRPHTPIILYTGYADRLDKEKLTREGVKAVLEKPLGLQELAGILGDHLRVPEQIGR